MKNLVALAAFSALISACGQKSDGDHVFRIQEQMNLYPQSTEVDGEDPPPVVTPPTDTTDPPVVVLPPDNPPTVPPVVVDDPPVVPPEEPPVVPPVVDDPEDDTPPVVVVPGDVEIPIKRACWDRPRDWPTVNRADEKALFSIVDPAGKRIFSRQLKGSDFKKKTITVHISGATFTGPNNSDLSKNKSTQIEVCQVDGSNKCHGNKDDKGSMDAGLIFIREGKIKSDKTYEWKDAPFEVEDRVSLSKVDAQHPLEVIVENIGQYSGSKKDQIKKDYCDVVYKTTSPLALDLSGRGFLPTRQSDGASFDLDADGSLEKMSSLGLEGALLALDLNGNGKIDDGSELFGEATVLNVDGSHAANGFVALTQYDVNRDGTIDSGDSVFADLRVWIDANHNGESESGEVRSLEEVQVKSLSLKAVPMKETDLFGNEVRERSTYTNQSGHARMLVDIWFSTIDEVVH